MAKKMSFMERIGYLAYGRPDINKKVVSMKKSIDEINKIINEPKK